MFLKLFYKKKSIIYFLSAIFLFLVCQNNVLALPGDNTSISEVSNYSYNGLEIVDPSSFANFDNYTSHILVMNIDTQEQSWLFTNSSHIAFRTSGSCSFSDFPVSVSSACISSSYSRGFVDIGQSYYYPTWTNYSPTSTTGYWFGGKWVVVYSDSIIYQWSSFGQSNISLNNPGFLVSVDTIIHEPSVSVLLNDLIYDSNDYLVHRFLFEINDYNSDYSYFYRYLSYDGTSYLSSWLDLSIRDLSSSGSSSYVTDYFYNYSNIRIEIKIVSSSDTIVYDNFFVVSDFSYNNYTEYNFNTSNPYYYISGFSVSSLSDPFYISRFGSPDSPFMQVYDFTTKSTIPGYWVRSSYCYVENIYQNNCSYFDISQYSDYDNSHVYGIRINNPYFSTTFPGDDFIFPFSVYNSLYVSSSGDFSNGFISEDYITYVDNSGTLTTTSGVGNLSSDFTTLNDFFGKSVIHFNSFFIFISSGFNLFFTSLSSPLVWCWVFCFCMFIIAYCIKFFY